MIVRNCLCLTLLLTSVPACEEGAGAATETSAGDTDMDPSGNGGTQGSTAGPGSDGSGSGEPTTGDPDPGTGADTAGLDEVEVACEADCEALLSTECAPTHQNILTCKLQCASVTVQLGDFCLSEYTSVIQCRADGGYDCVNGFPTPRSTCAAEHATYTECMSDLGCKRYCDAAIDAGCGGASFEACFDACQAEKAALPEFCGLYWDSVPLCEAQSGIECVDGQPQTLGDCGYAVGRVADCIADESDDLCQGYCYLAGEVGCGSGCSQDCQSRLMDTNCGSQFDSLVDCQLRHGAFECSAGRLIGVDTCESYETSYQTCLDGG